jgi:hypothetical protein
VCSVISMANDNECLVMKSMDHETP